MGDGRSTRSWKWLALVSGCLLASAAQAQTFPPRFRTNPQRAQRARELARPEIAPDPNDGGTVIDGFDFWWIGATSSSLTGTNSGAEAILQEVDSPPNGPGCFDCWISEYLDDDRWGQVGFSACTMAGSAPFVSTFYQVWDTSVAPGTLLVDGDSQVTAPGLHTYAMNVSNGTTWEYSVDGTVFGSIDMGSSNSTPLGAVSVLCEEGDGVTKPFVPPAIATPVAMSVFSDGTWSGVSEGLVYDSAHLSGVTGNLQDGSLAQNAIVIGGDGGDGTSGAMLWNQASAGFAPDAGPAGAQALAPPLVTLTEPSPNTTVSGLVTLAGTVSVTAASTPLQQVLFVVQDAKGNHLKAFEVANPPYMATWDTTQEPNEVFFVALAAVDMLGRQTYTDYSVTVDNHASGTTGAGTGGTGTAGTGATSGSATAAGGSSSGGSSGSTSGGGASASTGATRISSASTAGTPTGSGLSRGCSSAGGSGSVLAGLAFLLLPRRRNREAKRRGPIPDDE